MLFSAVSCDALMPFIRLIRDGIIPLIQIGIPIILILLGMFDLGKAVMASKEDEIKSAQKLLIKRCIYAVDSHQKTQHMRDLVFGLIDNSGDYGQENWITCWNQK